VLNAGNVGVGTASPGGTLDVEGSGGVILNAGNVGVGTSSPASTLSVNGGVQVGGDAASCGAANAGTLRWNSSSLKLEVCNGTTWTNPNGSSFPGMFSVQVTACTNAAPACPAPMGPGYGGCTCPYGNAMTGGSCSCPSGTNPEFLLGSAAAAPGYFLCTYWCN
jgi:hypothetical protein